MASWLCATRIQPNPPLAMWGLFCQLTIMDNLTHSLVGALFGQMGLKRKTGLAMPTLIIAANIPDIDAVATLLGGQGHLAIRRGITHGPPAMMILPLLLWCAMLAYAKWRPNEARLPIHKGWLLALAYIGCLSHPLFDWFNSYGIRFLEPFSRTWFYGDTLFIIDLWLWIALIAGVWISRRKERNGQGDWTRPAWFGFATVGAYIFANGAITGVAESEAMLQLQAKQPPNASMPRPIVVANPVPVFFWQRDILWRDDVNYGSGHYQIGRGVTLNTDFFPQKLVLGNKNEKSMSANEKAFRFWSRMPVETLENGTLMLTDQRFLNPVVRTSFQVPVVR